METSYSANREKHYLVIHRLIVGLSLEVVEAADNKEQLLRRGALYIATLRKNETNARVGAILAFRGWPRSDLAGRKILEFERHDFVELNGVLIFFENYLKSCEDESLDDIKQAFSEFFQRLHLKGWGYARTPWILPPD